MDSSYEEDFDEVRKIEVLRCWTAEFGRDKI